MSGKPSLRKCLKAMDIFCTRGKGMGVRAQPHSIAFGGVFHKITKAIFLDDKWWPLLPLTFWVSIGSLFLSKVSICGCCPLPPHLGILAWFYRFFGSNLQGDLFKTWHDQKKLTNTNTKTKTKTMKKTKSFWEPLLRAILETCDLWDICSEWWEDMTWPKNW